MMDRYKKLVITKNIQNSTEKLATAYRELYSFSVGIFLISIDN